MASTSTRIRGTCRACKLLLLQQRDLRLNSKSALARNRHYATTTKQQGEKSHDEPVAGPSNLFSRHSVASDESDTAGPPPAPSSKVATPLPDATIAGNGLERLDPSSSTPSSQLRKPADLNAALSLTRALALSRLASIRLAAFNKLQRQQEELGKRFSEAGQSINAVTGYGEIDSLKAEVTRQGADKTTTLRTLYFDPDISPFTLLQQSWNCSKLDKRHARRKKLMQPPSAKGWPRA